MNLVIFGLKVTALGFGTVFVALIGLMFLIDLQSKFLAPKPKTKVQEPKQEVQPTVVETIGDDSDEIAAVIAAAIAAYGQPVVVKTITIINGSAGSTWAATGRTEAMNLRKFN